MPTLRAVLFDMDDTLIDWDGFHGDWRGEESKRMRPMYDYVQSSIQAINYSFEEVVATYFNHFQGSWEQSRTTLRAPHLERAIEQTLVDIGIDTDDVDVRTITEHYAWDAAPGVTVFPDVPPALQRLIDSGIKIGIVTNSGHPMWLRDRELVSFGLLEYFPSCRITAADVSYLKPHPNIFKHALGCVDARPEETVFVGDNPVADVMGAQDVGMKGILRTRPNTENPTRGMVTPDAIITSLAEMFPHLETWFEDAG